MTVTVPGRAKRVPDNIEDTVGRRSHFSISRMGKGWCITVHRRGRPDTVTLCATEGEANRLRQRLSSEGLIGLNGGAR